MASNQQQGDSEPAYSKKYTESTDVPFFNPDISSLLSPETRSLLETYSAIPPVEIIPHLRAIREKAWAIRSYPSIGVGSWLDPPFHLFPIYPQILQRLRSGSTLIDVGCFVGQDLRRLVVDGAPSESLYGIDNVNFWDLGFEMFRDRDRFHARYIEADILVDTEKLQELKGKMDVITVTHLLHLWKRARQIEACKRFVELSRGVGSMVLGLQIGSLDAGERPWNDEDWASKDSAYAHDPVTFGRMWEQIGEETGTKWEVQAEFRKWEDVQWGEGPKAFFSNEKRCLQFLVTRKR